ncbi:MAG: 50S ribosomal protein L18 [bacterium]
MNNRQNRHKRIRAKIIGKKSCPRLSVFRSNKHLDLQLIDDDQGKTIASVRDTEIEKKLNKKNLAKEAGKLIAQKAIDKKIEKVVFDRGGYRYHGRVKAVAEGAREAGLKF